MSHALLVAVLMELGGSHDLSADALLPDTMGTPGRFHSVELVAFPDGGLRVSVAPRPEQESVPQPGACRCSAGDVSALEMASQLLRQHASSIARGRPADPEILSVAAQAIHRHLKCEHPEPGDEFPGLS